MKGYRIERDSLGEVQVPIDALWGAQTQRAVENFPVHRPMPGTFVRALARIKWCAARVNAELGLLPPALSHGIMEAATAVMHGDYDDHFPVDVFQTGSGTSSNMNMNEVIASVCRAAGIEAHPNDHINLGQSSNDTIPTAMHLAVVESVTQALLPALDHLCVMLEERAVTLDDVIKTGRTHLMDAMPITLAQELRAWVSQLHYARQVLCRARDDLLAIPQGGTAVGTGVNTHPRFAEAFAQCLAEVTGFPFEPMDTSFAGQSAIDRPLGLSAALRGLATVLMKIANDLRWMNSGPLHGLGEIRLPVVQPGSSIMPGKVNPVICESLCMICAQVTGFDQANVLAAQSGNFQLNVMLPLVAANLLESTRLLCAGSRMLADRAIKDFTVNQEHIAQSVSRNPVLVTALNPVVGYDLAARIAREAYRTGQAVIDVAEDMTDLSRAELESLLDPKRLTHP